MDFRTYLQNEVNNKTKNAMTAGNALNFVGGDYIGDGWTGIDRPAFEQYYYGSADGSVSDAAGQQAGLDAVANLYRTYQSAQQPTQTAPTGGGGGTPAPVLDRLAVENTQKTINEIPGLLAAALEAERTRYNNAISGFGAQEAQQRKTYDQSTTTNQQNYDSNFMDSIRAGIRGLGGLMNILRGTGASGGTAEGQVKDVVGGITSQDIRAGADTRQENQRGLDTSLSNFLTDLSGRRRENEDTFENNQRAVRRDSNSQLQELYGKLAGYYDEADMSAERAQWMNKAGSLTPEIARDSRTQVSQYNSTPIEVRAPELTAFAGPTQPAIASAPRNGQVGSGIFTIGDRREREEQRQPVAVGV